MILPHSNNPRKMKLNVHDLFLKDALDEIMVKLDECRELGNNTLEIIHGYKHGTIIKDYIRSDGFITDVARNGHEFASKNFSDKGVSLFQLKPSRITLNSRQKLKSESSRNTIENKVAPIFCIKCKEPMDLLKELNWYKCSKCGKLIKR